MRTDVRSRFTSVVLGTGALAVLGLWNGVASQDNPEKPVPRPEARDKLRDKVDSAQATKQDARGTTRDAREGARDTAREDRQTTRDTREASRETVRDDREQIRDARRDIRGARREFIAARIRSGDLGLWVRRAANGLMVADLAQSGAIHQTGLMEGDEIVSVAGQPVHTERELVDRLFADHLANRAVPVVIIRKGQQLTLHVQPQPFVDEHLSRNERLHDFGLIVDESNPNRVLVQAVIPRSPAFYGGVRGGDQVTGFNGQRIAAVVDLIRGLASAKPGMTSIEVNRNNQSRQLDIEIPSDAATDEAHTTLRPALPDVNSPRPANPQPPNPALRTPANEPPRLAPPR